MSDDRLALVESLPSELYTAIILQLEPLEASTQQTILGLIRALPRSPISAYHLLESINIGQPIQAVRQTLHFRRNASDALRAYYFVLSSWKADADVVVNLLDILPNLREIALCIGPTFTPDHLVTLFNTPKLNLRHLSLRFRPYVQQASYYQFLKGAYFDSTLEAFCRWPDIGLPSLSLVQDPLPVDPDNKLHFAQPLVFFRLDPLAALGNSDFMSSVQYYRLRIPNRQVAQFIVGLPSLQYLDLSSCNISEIDVAMLLQRMTGLLHLILDGCGLLRGDLIEGSWAAFGKMCAHTGVRRARLRERAIKEWYETIIANSPNGLEDAEIPSPAPRVKRGRRGLGTATISIRKPQLDIKVRSLRSESSFQRTRIFPPTLSLRSLAINPVETIPKEHYAKILSEFELGWLDGVSKVLAARARLALSFKNGVRLMRFTEDSDDTDSGMDGLEDVDPAILAFEQDRLMNAPVPILCLAGPGSGANHTPGCAHKIGMQIWKDDL